MDFMSRIYTGLRGQQGVRSIEKNLKNKKNKKNPSTKTVDGLKKRRRF
jgi:hypothetical protein